MPRLSRLGTTRTITFMLLGLIVLALAPPSFAASTWAGIDWDGEFIEPTNSITIESDGSFHVVTTGPDDDAFYYEALPAPSLDLWVGGTFTFNADVGNGSHQQFIAAATAPTTAPVTLAAWRTKDGNFTNSLYLWHDNSFVDTGYSLAVGVPACIELHTTSTETTLYVDSAPLVTDAGVFPAVTHVRLGTNGPRLASDWSAANDFYFGSSQQGCGAGAPPEADLALTIVDSRDPVAVDAPLAYALTLDNAGPNAASGVSITDTLASGVQFVSASWPGGTCTEVSGIVTCGIGAVSSGETVVVTINVLAPSAIGDFSNTAVVSAAAPRIRPAPTTRPLR
jgi:uncharacterized repeat protein (TIGR01451 family)